MEAKKYEALSLSLNAWLQNELKVTGYAYESTFSLSRARIAQSV
jgi:hypothetical protein